MRCVGLWELGGTGGRDDVRDELVDGGMWRERECGECGMVWVYIYLYGRVPFNGVRPPGGGYTFGRWGAYVLKVFGRWGGIRFTNKCRGVGGIRFLNLSGHWGYTFYYFW